MQSASRSHRGYGCRVLVPLAAVLAGAASPLIAQPGESWEIYQQRLLQQRQDEAERYRRWQGGRDDRYDRWRQPPAEAARPRDVLDLFDGNLKGGQYSLDLPFGRISVNVRPRDEGPPPGGWGSGNYHSAHELVRKLQDPLRDLHILFERAGHQDLRDQVLKARTESERLKNALAARAAPEIVERHYEDFDRLWHQVFFHIRQREDLGPTVQRRAENVRDYDNLLHQVIHIAPAEPYDRLTVLALARQLAVATEHLLDDVDRGLRDDPWIRAVRRNAERVHRHALDLYQTVHDNAGFVAVQDEFAQFDRAWHDFVRRVEDHPRLSRTLRDPTRQVWQLETALHEELYLDTPLPGDRRLAALVAGQIERTAEHLADDLRYEEAGDTRWAIYDARQLAAAARSLQDALAGSGPPDDAGRIFDALLEHWRNLVADIEHLGRQASPHTRRVVEELHGQIERLSGALGTPARR